MSSLDVLITLPIDEVFQKWNVTTIKSVQTDLEREIQKKKDEIRTLVGEKYRDFVDVSENIHVMDERTKSIAREVGFISSSLNVLKEMYNERKHRKKNFLVDDGVQTERRKVFLRKLLIELENQLWIETESKRFLIATSLLQFAVYIKTKMNLDSIEQEVKYNASVSDVWDLVLRFPVIINQFLEEELRSVDLTSCAACECFCSLALLQNLCAADIIKKFLSLRLETLECILSKENNSLNVRSRFANSFSAIIKTLEILYYCFRQTPVGDLGEYWKCLQNLKNPQNLAVINYIDKDKIAPHEESYISSDVRSFKVKINTLVPLEELENGEQVNQWIQTTKGLIVAHVPSYLNLVNSLQNLCALKQTALMDNDHWTQILEYFNLKDNFQVWEDMYEPLIVERAMILLTQRWNVSFARVRHKIENIFQGITDKSKSGMEYDLHSFLWTMNVGSSSKKSSQRPNSSSSEDLHMKVLKLAPHSEKLCVFIESSIVDIMTEFSSICPVDDSDAQHISVLRKHQISCCINFFERLIHLSEDLINVEDICDKIRLFWARFLSGILVYCPSVKQCISLDDKENEWHFLSAKLCEESLNIWKKWSSRVLRPILVELQSFDSTILSAPCKLKYLTKWDAVKLIEQNDSESSTNLELRVPFQASFFVHNIVNKLAILIGRTLPPKTILLEMRDLVVSEIFTSVEKAGKQPIHHTTRLQFLFDVKYVTSLLILAENEELSGRSEEIIQNLETKIDPVDLDLIMPTLSSNVQLFVYKTQGMFGSLMNDKLCTIEQPVESSDDPSTIHIATNDIPSFPLFPVSSVQSN